MANHIFLRPKHSYNITSSVPNRYHRPHNIKIHDFYEEHKLHLKPQICNYEAGDV